MGWLNKMKEILIEGSHARIDRMDNYAFLFGIIEVMNNEHVV
jgi:hypothetical protein